MNVWYGILLLYNRTVSMCIWSCSFTWFQILDVIDVSLFVEFYILQLNWWFIELFVFTGHMIVHFAITILYIFLQFLGLVYNLDHWFIWSIVALRYCSWSIFILTLFWEFDFMFRGLPFLVPFLVRKMMKAFIFMLFPLFVQITLISDKDGLFLQRSKWGSRIFSTGHPKVSLFEKH